MFKHQQEFVADLSSNDSLDDSDKTSTHSIILPVEKRLNIRPNKSHNFWVGYCNLIRDGNNVSIAEVIHSKQVPLICDFDFRFREMPDEPFPDINDSFIFTLVSCIQEMLLNIYVLDDTRFISCFIMKSDDGYKIPGTNVISRSLRLQFPYVCVEPVAVQNRLFPEMIDIFRRRNVLSKLENQPDFDWDKIVNVNIYQEPVMMYGGIQEIGEPRKEVYKIVGIIDKNGIDYPDDVKDLDIEKIAAPNTHSDIRRNPNFEILKYNPNYDYWLPLFLSINYYEVPLHTKTNYQNVNRNVEVPSSPGKMSNWDRSLLFLRMIPVDEKNNICVWYDIGKSLFTESNGSPDGLNTWIDMTNDQVDNPELTEALCRSSWLDFNIDNLNTIKTLAWYARKFNPTEYVKYHREKMERFKEISLTKFDTDIADAFFQNYWLDYVYSTSPSRKTGGCWYKFKMNRWMKMDQALDISHLISTDFYGEFAKMSKELADKRCNTNDEAVKEACTSKLARIEALIKKLKTYSSKRSIINEASTYFHDENFEKVVNSNLNTMGHMNKVHELINGWIHIRDGKPEDYITKSTGLVYDDKMDAILPDGTKAGYKDPRYLELDKWFRQVFTDEDTRSSFLNFCSSLLIRGNPDKIIPIWSGGGDNSKSMMERLLELLLGAYAFKFDNGSVTGKSSSGSPSPELAQAEFAALGFFDELDEKEDVKSGFLKKVSGGDNFFARMLHDNGGKIMAVFKIIIVCNIIPRFNSVHRSIVSRVVIYPFTSLWVDRNLAPVNEEEQFKTKTFPMNNRFNIGIPKLAPAFLWMLKERYPQYLDEGVPKSRLMRENAGEYWTDIDIYQAFKRECLEECWKVDPVTNIKIRDRDSKLSVEDCYKHFKIWFKSTYEGEKIPNLRDFKANSVNHFGKPVEDRFWLGIKIQEVEVVNLYGGGNSMLYQAPPPGMAKI